MSSLGEQLKAARSAMDKSLDDISSDTNISKQYLQALEEDNYDIFPAQVYARGFLSVYAKYVGLDPELLAEQYDKKAMLSKLPGKETSESTTQSSRGNRKTLRRFIPLIVVIFVLAFLAVLFWYYRDQFI